MESETLAFESEMALIQLFGRKNNGTGILRNLTDGGEGPSGYRHTEEAIALNREAHAGKALSKSHKQKISAALKGKPLSESHKQNLRGRAFSPEHCKRLSESSLGNKRALGVIRTAVERQRIRDRQSGRTLSIETRQKISAAKMGKVPWNKGLRGTEI